MDAALVRKMVAEFRVRVGFTGSEDHCFAPWYLHQTFHLAEATALAQASDGNYDFGIDGFAFEGARKVVLVQAKYTDNLQHINKGFKEMAKALNEIARGLEGLGAEAPIQNKVLVNLRAALNRLTEDERKSLIFEFQVLHLSPDDEVILANKFRDAMTSLKEAAETELADHVLQIRQVGPRALGPHEVVSVPPAESSLRLRGAHSFSAGPNCQMITGIGYLADLVELYRVRRDDLFSRNVRYFLTSKKNTEKGPAGKMRSTLKEMTVEGKIEPERFATFHNGLTLFARKAVVHGDGVKLRDPFVLNGCQTVKNAFLFRHDKGVRDRIKPELWDRIAVPVRIIDTGEEELVRSITVNNNRQNSMSAAALRSNDPVQIRLESRFRDRSILYQRQEGAFDAIWATNPELLEDEFENTQGRAVDIHELARSIAASMGKVAWALHPNDLFESDKAYEACFDEEKTLASIVYLTFLQNVHDVIGLVLKKDLNLEPKAGGPKPARFIFQTICLLTRYLAREDMSEFVATWGTRLYGRSGAFREELRKILNSPKSRIRAELAANFMKLEGGDTELINHAFERCQKDLKLRDNIDPFAAFKDLDQTTSADSDHDEEQEYDQ
jgi:hypothetical protein